MKRERRHELHTNILALWVSRAIEWAKPRVNSILAVVLLVAVVVAAVTLWRRHSTSGTQDAWDALNHAVQVRNNPDPAIIEKLTDEFSYSDIVPWAAITAADMYLQQGCDEILRDKGKANQLLQKALENYNMVLAQSQLDPLRERATFGLARCYEALSGTRRAENELQKAIESYETVVKTWPKGAYVAQATRRLEELRLPDTKRFYDKLAQYDPKPIFTDAPAAPGQGFNLGTVPPEPGKKSNDNKSAAPSSKPPALQKTPPPPAAKTTPAAPADKPAEKPAESSPAKPK